MGTDISAQMMSLAVAAKGLSPHGGQLYVPALQDARRVVEMTAAGQSPETRPLLDSPPSSVDVYA